MLTILNKLLNAIIIVILYIPGFLLASFLVENEEIRHTNFSTNDSEVKLSDKTLHKLIKQNTRIEDAIRLSLHL
jgi:hypothetical protein